jgi:hypothetical protein
VLSFSKILLTVGVVLLVWVVGRALTRRLAPRPAPPSPAARGSSVELAKCALCETYVGRDSAPCDRADCPQRA